MKYLRVIGPPASERPKGRVDGKWGRGFIISEDHKMVGGQVSEDETHIYVDWYENAHDPLCEVNPHAQPISKQDVTEHRL